MRLVSIIILIWFYFTTTNSIGTLYDLQEKLKAILNTTNDSTNVIETEVKPTKYLSSKNNLGDNNNKVLQKTRRFNDVNNEVEETLPELTVDFTITKEITGRRNLDDGNTVRASQKIGRFDGIDKEHKKLPIEAKVKTTKYFSSKNNINDNKKKALQKTRRFKDLNNEVKETLPELTVDFTITKEITGRRNLDDDNTVRASQKIRRFNSIDKQHKKLPKLAVDFTVSNEDIERRNLIAPGYRRYVREELNRNGLESRSIGLTSSSAEENDWKAEYKFRWNMRKEDALQDPRVNQTRGHVVNMAGARPWRIPCGDMNQADYAVGTCTLPYECPAELRIFRGDYQCGRNSFVCCSATYYDKDMYEAFDPTMTDTSGFSTSSEEIRKNNRGSREVRVRKRIRKRNRTLKARYRRKRFIKKSIRKIAKEVRKELNRAFRNSTENRREVIRNLKIMIKKMKEKFRDERHIAKFQQDLDLANINLNLQNKLKKIRGLNYNFLTNDTFRAIIVNGTAGREGPKLFEAYPELNAAYPELGRAAMETRRFAPSAIVRKKQSDEKNYFHEYDIEFGVLT